LTNLELLGLLSSRIIHDLKNKLAVISGHAQFAEIAKQNPKVAADGMAIIKRVSEEAGKHVESLAKLRRSLPAEHHACAHEDVLVILRDLLAGKPGWKVLPPPPEPVGQAAVQGRWLKFLLHHFLSLCQAPQGEVEVDQASGEVPIEGSEVAPLFPERPCLRIRFRCAGNPGAIPLTEDPVRQFQALAILELIRKLEGGLIQHTSTDGVEEVTLLIPLNPANPGKP
jgi:hypothetical protein